MHIVVCVKQVPDTVEIQIDRHTNRLIRDGVPSILNPFDGFALEVALRLKDKYGAKITAITMGPSQAASILKKCRALGIDQTYLLNDSAFAGSDTFCTGHILASAIQEIGKMQGNVDLIIVGKQAIDGDTAQVGPIIAEQMSIPQITCVNDTPTIENGNITAVRECDIGCERITTFLPALISVAKTSFELRYAKLGGIVKANRKEYPVLYAKDLSYLDLTKIGIDGSPTVTKKTYVPKVFPTVIFLDDKSINNNTAKLASIIDNAGLL